MYYKNIPCLSYIIAIEILLRHQKANKIGNECSAMPDWEISHRLSERLASLGIMGDKLRALLRPLPYDSAVMYGGIQGGLNGGPQNAERRNSLGQLYV